MFVATLVNLYTVDIEAALHFYRDLLGFAETFCAWPCESTHLWPANVRTLDRLI